MSSLLLDSKYNDHEYLKNIYIYGYFSCLHPSWTCKDSGADGSCYLALIGLVSNPSIYYLCFCFCYLTGVNVPIIILQKVCVSITLDDHKRLKVWQPYFFLTLVC